MTGPAGFPPHPNPGREEQPEETINRLLTKSLESKGQMLSASAQVHDRVKAQLEHSLVFMLCNVADMTDKTVNELDIFFGEGDSEHGLMLDMPEGCVAAVKDGHSKGPRYAIRKHDIETPTLYVDLAEIVSGDRDIVDCVHDAMNDIIQELEMQVMLVKSVMDKGDLTALQLLIFQWPQVHIKKEAYRIEYYIRASFGVAAVALTGDATCQHPYLKLV
jgi:hypothetical protein